MSSAPPSSFLADIEEAPEQASQESTQSRASHEGRPRVRPRAPSILPHKVPSTVSLNQLPLLSPILPLSQSSASDHEDQVATYSDLGTIRAQLSSEYTDALMSDGLAIPTRSTGTGRVSVDEFKVAWFLHKEDKKGELRAILEKSKYLLKEAKAKGWTVVDGRAGWKMVPSEDHNSCLDGWVAFMQNEGQSRMMEVWVGRQSEKKLIEIEVQGDRGVETMRAWALMYEVQMNE